MEIRHLLKSQANQVFDVIKESGLDPADFEWRDTTGHASLTIVSRLVHRSSGYYFTFDNLTLFNSKWEPGEQTKVDSKYWKEWEYQLDAMYNWLSYLRRETEKSRPLG